MKKQEKRKWNEYIYKGTKFKVYDYCSIYYNMYVWYDVPKLLKFYITVIINCNNTQVLVIGEI